MSDVGLILLILLINSVGVLVYQLKWEEIKTNGLRSSMWWSLILLVLYLIRDYVSMEILFHTTLMLFCVMVIRADRKDG